MKDADFLFLTSMLRAREVSMLMEDKIERMLDAPNFDDAAKLLMDCGYPDMSGMNTGQVENILQKYRSDIFAEISNYGYAHDLLNIFRLKYDYHNVKVLVKSAGAKVDASYLLSDSGRIDVKELSEAFVTGQHGDLPEPLALAMESATGILSRTGDPQLSDIEIDKAYFGELSLLAKTMNDDFITGYVRLMIDSANLRILIRSALTGRSKDFLQNAAIPGGSVGIEEITKAFEDGEQPPFTDDALANALRLSTQAKESGAQTGFELACDNAVLNYATDTTFISFGPAPIISYLTKLEWEITAVRMILTGKRTGISKDIIRERLRDCHV